MDKAIFEAAQNPEERERYIKAIQDLASKAIPGLRQKREKAEKEGLADWGASLGRRIEQQKFMSERTEDIIKIASKFYNEKLVEQRETLKRDARREERRVAESEEWRTEEREKEGREARKKKKEQRWEEKRKGKPRSKIKERSWQQRKGKRRGERRDRKLKEKNGERRSWRRRGEKREKKKEGGIEQA